VKPVSAEASTLLQNNIIQEYARTLDEVDKQRLMIYLQKPAKVTQMAKGTLREGRI
jgi:hypothetical protein